MNWNDGAIITSSCQRQSPYQFIKIQDTTHTSYNNTAVIIIATIPVSII